MAPNASTTDKRTKAAPSAKQRPQKQIRTSHPPDALSSMDPGPVTRPCTRCKRPVPFAQVLKMCEKCRTKEREKGVRRAARRKQERERGMSSNESVKRAVALIHMDTDESESERGGIGGEKWQPIKRLKIIEFEGVKRKGQAPAVVKNTESKKRPAASHGDPTSYQSQSLLLSALSSQPTFKPIVFNATYSIISTSSPPVSLVKRVEMVDREVRNTFMDAGVGGGGFNRHSPLSQSTTALSSSQTYACLCSHTTHPTALPNTAVPNTTTMASSSSSKSNSLKRTHTQSNLSHYFAGLPSKSSTSSSSSSSASASGAAAAAKQSRDQGRGCGGTIKITVEDDFTHSLGVKGHRVLVFVEH